MNLPVFSFSQLVDSAAAAVQGACEFLIDMTTGSVLRSLVESSSSAALWIQYLILKLALTIRAATSTGSDLDSWVADFGLVRLPATYATGSVTFARLTPSSAAFVPVGMLVQTTDGSLTFSVVADPTNANWVGASNGYLVSAGTSTLTVPIQCQTPGTVGNVIVDAISVIATAVAGIDTVQNSSAFTNALDSESDAALRVRFQNFINSRSLATALAVNYAVGTVQANLTWGIAENTKTDGSFAPGWFTVTFDDGSGTPSAGLRNAVYAAVDAVRPLCVQFAVQGPSVLTANVTFTLTAAPGYSVPALDAAASLAVTAYIDALPLSAVLAYTRLAQVIYDSAPGIANVSGLLVNAATADIGGGLFQVVRAGTISGS